MSEPKPNKAEAVANFVGRDMLALVVGELKQAQKPWHKLSEAQQETVIRRAEQDIRAVLTRGFLLIVAADFQKAAAVLEKVEFTAKGVNGKLSLKGDVAERHKMADCAGSEVVVILTNAQRYLAKMEEIRADADQPALPFAAPQNDDDDPEHGEGTDAGGGEVLLTEELDVAGLSFVCVRDVLALVGIECSEEIVVTWTADDRRACINYAGAKHIAQTSENYLTKGGTIPDLPAVLGGAA
jgi:hypothetical protein